MDQQPSTSKAAAQDAPAKPPQEPLPPALDITSEEFDPLQALYADPSIPLTKRKSKVIFQNMAAFENAYAKKGLYGLSSKTEQNKTAEKPVVAEPSTSARRFLPHQMVIQTGGIKKKNKRTLLRQIENMEGPLAILRECMQKKQKIKVYTRSEHGIRGTITGYVMSFDKHWNLLLSDVQEKWKRRKYKYDENKFCGSASDCSERLRKLGIVVPEMAVKSVNRKNVEITRIIPKLLVRGEEVVLVITAEGKKAEKKATAEM